MQAKERKGMRMANILVVDDAEFMRMTLKKMVEAHGYTVVAEAGTGAAAVEEFARTRPDLVLLDITMPEMGGVEALRRIKEIDSAAKVVICSAVGQQAIVAQTVEYGAIDFVVKPFEEYQLIAAIKSALAG